MKDKYYWSGAWSDKNGDQVYSAKRFVRYCWGCNIETNNHPTWTGEAMLMKARYPDLYAAWRMQERIFDNEL